MGDPRPQPSMPPPKRRFAARTERATATKRRIVEAAHRLFVAGGYLDTTMADIAAEAGVAVQTLYLGFGSKVQILSATLDQAVAGDDQPVTVVQRPWVDELERQGDGPTALALLISEGRRIVERAAPIYARIQEAAADVEVAEFLSRQKAQRYATHHALVEVLSRKRGFNHDLGVDRAADVVYGFLSEDSYRLLCVERGWTGDEWERGVASVLLQVLFPPRSHR